MTKQEVDVIGALNEIFMAKGVKSPSLTPDTILEAELGLESLDFAELVIRLEERTGLDPFADGRVLHIHTIADLASLYEREEAAAC